VTPAIRIERGTPLPPLSAEDRLTLLVVGGDEDALSRLSPRLRIDLPDPVEAARQLYDALHRCDASASSMILVRMPPDQPAWAAIRDRLRRAAAVPEPAPSDRHQS
jgi:hypothetical protein